MLSVRIRAFRALDDEASCALFADGHARVLSDYGVSRVTSSSTSWFYNPQVYVLLAENMDTLEPVGGVRIHIADGVTNLPMEDAVSIWDKRVFDLIAQYITVGTGELCGLWNAKSVAGKGLGSYVLMRAGISAASTLNLPTLFALCASHTLQISVEKGFEVEKSIGNEGTFIYPKLDLIATTIIIRDTNQLPNALNEERRLILELRNNKELTRIEQTPKGEEVQIQYSLDFTRRGKDVHIHDA
jgi:hypothetical protein